MNATIGIYPTHEKAFEAVEELKLAGFPVEQISLIGKAVIIDDLIHIKRNSWIMNTPAIIGAILGPILGLLIGMKILAIPGTGFLSGAGAFIGALGGFSLGLAAGGLITLLAIIVIKSRSTLKYHEHIEQKGFQVIAHGSSEDVNQAKEILDRYKAKIGSNSR